jgi:transcriptional regulator with XRE-family HTH domain
LPNGKISIWQQKNDMSIGNRLKALRSLKGLTQADMAAKLGIERRRYMRIEKGLLSPREIELKAIEQAFNVNPRWLRDGEGEMFLKVDTEGVKPQWASDPELIEIIQLLQEDPQAKKLVLKLLKGKKEMQEALQGFKVKVVEEG